MNERIFSIGGGQTNAGFCAEVLQTINCMHEAERVLILPCAGRSARGTESRPDREPRTGRTHGTGNSW